MTHTWQRLGPGDRQSLIALINVVCAEGRWMRTRRYQPTPAWEHAFNELDCPDHLLLVARDKSRLVGWCRAFPANDQSDNTTATLGIGLLPDYRNLGLGANLVRASLDWAGDVGLSRVTLMTQPDNRRAMHVFRKCGFTMSGNKHNGNIEMTVELGE